MKTEKVQVRHARARKKESAYQRHLEFFDEEEVLTPPRSNIICDAPVAPTGLRIQAGLVDGLLMAAGVVFGAAIFRFTHGEVSLDKQTLLFLTVALMTIPLLYKLLWTFAGLDTIGMRVAKLRLVDFDGNPPSQQRRYHRLIGSLISFLAAGMGLIWVFLDPDCLTWHDHMSCTFPTIASDLF